MIKTKKPVELTVIKHPVTKGWAIKHNQEIGWIGTKYNWFGCYTKKGDAQKRADKFLDMDTKPIMNKIKAFAKKWQTETVYLWNDEVELYFKHEPNKPPVKKVPTTQIETTVKEDNERYLWAIMHTYEVSKEVYDASPEYPPNIYWAKP